MRLARGRVHYDSQGKKLDVPHIIPIEKSNIRSNYELWSDCQSAQKEEGPTNDCYVPPFDLLALNESRTNGQMKSSYTVIGYYLKPEIIPDFIVDPICK